MSISILLADDHHIVRQGLRSLLESASGSGTYIIVGEASDGLQAVELAERLRPQVTVMDLMMPGLGGLEATRRIHTLTRVIILSMHANEAYVLEALQTGAYGYVLKDSTASDLIQAIQTVMEGRRYLSAPLSERAIEAYVEKAQPRSLDGYTTLTTREREVLQLVAEGYSTSDISNRLSISPRTVEIHRSNVMHKLNLRSQIDLVRYALRKGLLPMDEE